MNILNNNFDYFSNKQIESLGIVIFYLVTFYL